MLLLRRRQADRTVWIQSFANRSSCIYKCIPAGGLFILFYVFSTLPIFNAITIIIFGILRALGSHWSPVSVNMIRARRVGVFASVISIVNTIIQNIKDIDINIVCTYYIKKKKKWYILFFARFFFFFLKRQEISVSWSPSPRYRGVYYTYMYT